MEKPLVYHIIHLLERIGCESVFTIPGSLMVVLDYFDRHPSFRLFSAPHEEHLGFMALGAFRSSGKIPILLVTQGPGATNIINAVASAWRDRCPMVIISASSANIDDRISFQETTGKGHSPNIPALFRPITQAQIAVNINNAQKKLLQLEQILAVIDSPIFLEVDNVEIKVNFEPSFSLKKKFSNLLSKSITVPEIFSSIKTLPNKLESIISLADFSKQPTLLLGQGARYIQNRNLIRYAQKARIPIPVVTTLSAIDLVPTDCKGYLGNIGVFGRPEANAFLSEKCSQLISVGASLNQNSLRYWLDNFRNRHGQVININLEPAILPADLNVFDINVDLRNFALEEEINLAHNIQCRQVHPINKMINQAMPQKVFAVEAFRPDFFQKLQITEGDLLLTSAGHGSLGNSLPMAIGSSLHSNLPHVVICGDGGFLFTGLSILTAAKWKLRLMVLILKNNEYKTVADSQKKKFGRCICTDLYLPNLITLAASCGVSAYNCHTLTDVQHLVDEFISGRYPIVGVLDDYLIS